MASDPSRGRKKSFGTSEIPLEVGTVKRIFESRCKGLGLVAIADLLNAERIPSPKRGRWRNRDDRWTGSTIKGILENPVYVGDRVYNRLTFSRFANGSDGSFQGGKRANAKQEWVTCPDAHPAIVSRGTFEKANAVTEKHPVRPNHSYYKSTYLLTGLIKCLECSYSFQGFTHKKSGNRYYVDGGYINKGETVCRWFSIRQDKVERFVLESIRDSFFEGGMVHRTKEAIDRIMKTYPDEIIDQHASLEKTLKEVRLRIENLVGLAERGIQLDSIVQRIEELEKQRFLLEENKVALERSHLLIKFHSGRDSTAGD
jgi:site-specific DNA recombinase